MDVLPSPQPCAVGEATAVRQNEVHFKESYASKLCDQNSVEKPSNAMSSQANQNDPSKLELCAVNFDQEHPVIKFSMEDVNIFTREEGLHQAVVIKLSYGFPHVSEVRRIFSSQFGVKDKCNIGQLEYRHLLIRFDLFDDYAHFIGKSTCFLKSKGEEFLFRTFPWTFGFNPKEETSMAVVWISMPGLPPNLFARRSLLSIASAVGKPIAIDKATQDRTRPSTARVKVIINLLDKLPDLVKLQFVDSISGKSLEVEQIIVYDNIPSYCEFCKHQGHAERDCRYKSVSKSDYLANVSNGNERIVTKLQGDAREFLNKKRVAQVWKQKPMAEPLSGPSVRNGNGKEVSHKSTNSTDDTDATDATGSVLKDANEKCTVTTKAKAVDEGMSDQMENDSRDVPTKATLVEPLSDISNKSDLNDVNSTAFSNIRNAIEKGKKSMTPVSFKPISKSEFEASLGSSSFDKGSVSGTKYVHAQQNFSHLTGQDIICKANSSYGHNIEKTTDATVSLCPPNHKAYTWNNEKLQGDSLDDQSRIEVPVNEVIPELIRDQALVNKISVPLKILATKENLVVPDARDPQQMTNEVSFPNVMCNHTALNANVQLGTLQKNRISQMHDERLGDKSKEVSSTDALIEPKFDKAQFDKHQITVPLKPLSSIEDADVSTLSAVRNNNQVNNVTAHIIQDHIDIEDSVQNPNVPNNQVPEHLVMHNSEVHSSNKLISTSITSKSVADLKDAKVESGKTSISDENHTELSRSNHLETTVQLARIYSNTVDKTLEELHNVIVDPIQTVAAEVPLNQNLAKPRQMINGKEDDGQITISSEAATMQIQGTTEEEKAEGLMQNMEAHSHTNSVAKTDAHSPVTKHTPFISKRSKGAKLKVWNDQRDYDDEETWGDGLASFSWEEEDQEDDQEDSDDSVDQIIQIKDANKNMRANVKQAASPKTSLNHNAPLFVPKKQRETNWDDRMGEDVLIMLPMRHAKLKQTLQPSVLKPTRLRNKREI